MRRLFDEANPLMRALAVAADLLAVNLLTLAGCVPVLTAGASLSAAFFLAQQLVRGEESYLVPAFLRAYRKNLAQGTALGLLFAALGGLLWLNYLSALAAAPALRFAAPALGVLALAWGEHVFSLQARYRQPLGKTLRDALALLVAYFPRTLGMVVCTLALWVAALRFWRWTLPVLLMFGLSLPAYLCALFYRDIFEKLENDPSP